MRNDVSEPDTAPGTLSSCTNCDTGGNKLERVCDLRFLLFLCEIMPRIVPVGMEWESPRYGG